MRRSSGCSPYEHALSLQLHPSFPNRVRIPKVDGSTTCRGQIIATPYCIAVNSGQRNSAYGATLGSWFFLPVKTASAVRLSSCFSCFSSITQDVLCLILTLTDGFKIYHWRGHSDGSRRPSSTGWFAVSWFISQTVATRICSSNTPWRILNKILTLFSSPLRSLNQASYTILLEVVCRPKGNWL